MPLTRTRFWEARPEPQQYHGPAAPGDFDLFLLARAAAPFQWGTQDCCLFPADAIEAFTGVDIAADFRGQYGCEESAFALIRCVTGKGEDPATAVADAAEYCAAKHGLPEWHAPLFARRGDLVVLRDGGRLIAGIVHLNGRHAITVGEHGLRRLPLSAIARAWQV